MAKYFIFEQLANCSNSFIEIYWENINTSRITSSAMMELLLWACLFLLVNAIMFVPNGHCGEFRKEIRRRG